MRREPRVAGATVALAGVHVDRLVDVFTVSVNDVFAVELVVFVSGSYARNLSA